MADKGPGNPERTQRTRDRGEDEVRIDDSSVDLNSEVLAHLQLLGEQFESHVHVFINDACESAHQQLVADLRRFRNNAVVLEKMGTELVIDELLCLLDDTSAQHVGHDELKRVLGNAAPQLRHHFSFMQQDTTQDNALALLSTVNDCRASRDEMLLSDVLMLAAGVDMPATPLALITDQEWIDQRRQWVDYASTYHATLGQRLLHWWREGRAGAVAPLRRQLDRFAAHCDAHSYLQALVPLFSAASVVAQAISDKRLLDGPALRGLFAQLERNVHRCALVVSPEDLLPEDLLRNFLYYVAQIETDSEAAMALRRRFRLDRVRLVAKAAQPSKTTTIGVEYQLINAIRNGITQETQPLREWLDAPDEHVNPPKFVRARVRLGQLEPVLTLMGAKQALDSLKLVNRQLQKLSDGTFDDESSSKLARALSQMDSLLDQRARESVVRNKHSGAVKIPEKDIYIDFAIDACLREARNDILRVAESLLPLQKVPLLDILTYTEAVRKLCRVDAALQILPLPEVRPLVARLCKVLETLEQRPDRIGVVVPLEEPMLSMPEAETTSVPQLLAALLVAFDDYLACVLQPQPPAAQYLTDAEELLEQLYSFLELGNSVSSVGARPSGNVLPLPEFGGMTLDVDDEILELTLDDVDSGQHSLDSTLQFVFQHECLGCLDALDESVRCAIVPSIDSEDDTRLPNEKMLRALHTLTGSAQTVGAADVVSIVQPLQRAALVLQREGRFFDAEQSRTIGDISQSLRLMFESLVTDEPLHGLLKDTEQKLSSLLFRTLPGFSEELAAPASSLSIGSQVVSLDDVFIDEATEVLDGLRAVILSNQPLTEQTVNESLALLHTLKGSARMAGKPYMSDSAHELEARIQSMSPTEDPLDVFKTGYRNLQSQLMQISANDVLGSPQQAAEPKVGFSASYDRVSKGRALESTLLDLANDLTVTQASVSDELARLRHVLHDIESGLQRWQSASQTLESSDSDDAKISAFGDMLAYMETSRSSMRSALRNAEREQAQASRVGANLHQSLVRSRLVRLSDIGARLVNTVEDTAKICGVSARFELSGGELMLDKSMFRSLVAPLEHLARNAVVHGVEPVEQRIARAKPSEGVIALSAKMDGADLVLHFADDGRGINRDAVNELLEERGKSAVNSDAELQSLLFSAGFSSIGKADAIAGHGLGLSAVQAVATQLNGDVQLDTTLPQGVGVTLRIPQPMNICQIVLVKNDERLFGIPVAQVKLVNVDPDKQAASLSNKRQNIQEMSLQAFLGETEQHGVERDVSVANSQASSVVLDIEDRLLSIQVGQIVGYREVVAQPLGVQLASLNRFSAGSVLPAGQQVLILDVSALVASLGNHPHVVQPFAMPAGRPLALVVDASVTRRDIVQTMLLQKGIAVQLSSDGDAALTSLSQARPSVVIVDLGAHGLSFMRRVFKDYALSAPPMIVVGVGDNHSEREKAITLGAVGYLAKPYSEQALHAALLSAGLRLPDLTIA